MAKETYKITFNQDYTDSKGIMYMEGEVKAKLTFDFQMDFMMENLEAKKAGIFKIEPEKTITETAKAVVKKSDKEAYEEAKINFIDDLTAVEICSLREGKKKICHNGQVGFYLGLVNSALGKNEEIHISLHEIKDKERRSIYQSMKAQLLGFGSEGRVSKISGRIGYTNGLFTDEDLEGMVNELFKGKC